METENLGFLADFFFISREEGNKHKSMPYKSDLFIGHHEERQREKSQTLDRQMSKL